jgi:Zn-dependent protease with chaperone function
MQESFPACASAIATGDALAGSLTATQFSLIFESESFRLELPFNDLQVEADPEDKEKLFFRHPQHPDWEVYTYSREILNQRNLLQRTDLRQQIAEATFAQQGPTKHTKLVLGTLATIVSVLLLCWFANDWVISYIVSQMPAEWEANLGKEVMAEAKKELTFSSDPDRTNYLNEVAQRLVHALPKQPQPYKFYLLDEAGLNAFAIPGGHILVLDSMLDFIDTPEELAGALAHEIAHITQRHSLRRATATAGPTFAIRYLVGQRSGALGAIAATGVFLGNQRYSRSNESEADDVGMDYLVKAGINPRGMITFFKKLQKFEGRHGVDDSDILNDHPATSARIAHLEEKLKSFREPKYKSFANLVKPEAPSRENEIDKLVRAKSRQRGKKAER